MALLPDSRPAASGHLASYALTAAGDAPERDPADWVLEGLPVADVTAAGSAAADVAPTQQPPPLPAFGARLQPAGSEAAAAAAPTGQPGVAATRAAPPDNRPEGISATAPAMAKGVPARAPAAGGGLEALQGWRVLDAREGVLFGSRGGRLEFQVLFSIPCVLPCYRVFMATKAYQTLMQGHQQGWPPTCISSSG